MPFTTLVLSSFSLLMFFPTTGPTDDLKIVTRHSFGGITTTITQYSSGSYRRQENSQGMDNVEGHHLATIVHRGDAGNQNFMLDLDAHEYVVFETDEYGVNRAAKPRPANYTGTMEIWIESTDTGERQQMFGHAARHIITRERRVPGLGSCSSASEAEMDGWYIDDVPLPEWHQARSRGVAFLAAGGCGNKPEVHVSGVRPGFPLKVTTTTTLHQQMQGSSAKVVTSTNTMEVVEFSNEKLDPALFVVPQDFRQVKELTYMNRPRDLTAWARFKNWVADIFR